jgi:hypothetical protein
VVGSYTIIIKMMNESLQNACPEQVESRFIKLALCFVDCLGLAVKRSPKDIKQQLNKG